MHIVLTHLNYVVMRVAPLLWIVAAFGLYLAVALLVALVTGSAAVASAVAYVAIFVAVVLWRRSRPQLIELPSVPPASRGLKQFWILVTTTLLTCWFAGQVAASWAFQTYGSERYEQSIAAQEQTPLLLLVTSAIVLAPMGEEALMRGVAYPMVRKLFSPVVAAVVISGAFALIHGNLVQVMVAVPLGMLLAFVYERTQRLWSVVILHAFFNAAATVVPAALIAEIASLPLVIAALVLTALGLWSVRPSAGRLVRQP